jgi:hypothetical protein
MLPGVAWMAEFLECVAAAAMIALHELERLREAENKGRMLRPTARSRLPDALEVVLSTPIVMAASLSLAQGHPSGSA